MLEVNVLGDSLEGGWRREWDLFNNDFTTDILLGVVCGLEGLFLFEEWWQDAYEEVEDTDDHSGNCEDVTGWGETIFVFQKATEDWTDDGTQGTGNVEGGWGFVVDLWTVSYSFFFFDGFDYLC